MITKPKRKELRFAVENAQYIPGINFDCEIVLRSEDNVTNQLLYDTIEHPRYTEDRADSLLQKFHEYYDSAYYGEVDEVKDGLLVIKESVLTPDDAQLYQWLQQVVAFAPDLRINRYAFSFV